MFSQLFVSKVFLPFLHKHTILPSHASLNLTSDREPITSALCEFDHLFYSKYPSISFCIGNDGTHLVDFLVGPGFEEVDLRYFAESVEVQCQVLVAVGCYVGGVGCQVCESGVS